MGSSKSLALPIAIIIAGGLIAGAVYLSNTSSSGGGGSLTTSTAPIELRAVRGDEHILGNADAKVALVEFSDTECPFCKQFDATMRQVITAYAPSDVAWVYRHFPLVQLHPKAPKEAEALECATEQGGNETFWKFAEKLYTTTNSNNSLDNGVYNTPKPTPTGADGKPYYTEKTPRSASDAGQLSDIAVSLGLDKAAFEECLASERTASIVEEDTKEAANSGGSGTPYTIIVSKNRIPKATKDLLDSFIPSVGPDTFVLSEDGYRISMSGALPFEMVQQILETLVK